MAKTRPYSSPTRQRQADETRQRILDAARDLLRDKGYAGTTIGAVAQRAGVASQTVYAVFGSKTGIVAALLERAAFSPAYDELVREARATRDPVARLRYAASITRQIYDSQRAELGALSNASAVAPELADIELQAECQRLERQRPVLEELARDARLRPSLSVDEASEILWALTGRELYRMLVVTRGWTSDRYESWLADLIDAALLARPRRRR